MLPLELPQQYPPSRHLAWRCLTGRSPAAARQLASRARRRVQGVAPVLDADQTRQREIVEAFLAAARKGDFDALLEVLDPDVVVRANGTDVVRGAAAVAGRALTFTRFAQVSVPALVDGAVTVINAAEGRPIGVTTFTIAGDKVAVIDIIDNPGRIAEADLVILGRLVSLHPVALEAGDRLGLGQAAHLAFPEADPGEQQVHEVRG